jgi:hypothetical protein
VHSIGPSIERKVFLRISGVKYWQGIDIYFSDRFFMARFNTVYIITPALQPGSLAVKS